jgi:hypothetical protein
MIDTDCQRFRARLDEESDLGSLALPRHAAVCPECADVLARERRVRATLRSLPVPALRADFLRSAVSRAQSLNGLPERATMRRRDAFFALGGAMVAAALMLAVVLSRETATPSTMPAVAAGEVVQTVALRIGEIESVRLRIDAPRDFEQVVFSVELPGHVWLVDRPGMRAMSWEGALRKGENVLELPLMAQHGAGVLVAQVSWGEFHQRLQTRLVGESGGAAEGS